MNKPKRISFMEFGNLVAYYIEREYDDIKSDRPKLSLEQKRTVSNILRCHYDFHDYDVGGAAGNIMDYLREVIK